MIAPGQTIAGRYEVRNGVGRGGFATVFLAHDLNFERDVALKAISASESDDQETFFTTFVREARLIAKLLHPNILDVYDYGRVESEGYLVMPYADGGTLSTRLRAAGQLPLSDALAYFGQIVAGLTYAHQRNVIHRDLKPQNMLLFGDGRLVISDFGLAKFLSETNGLHSTRVTGTPLYMAPEQWVGQAGKATDVYALGIILYQLLAGVPPFQGENHSQLYLLHTTQLLPRLADVRPDLPPGLQLFLEHLTAKDPAERPPASAIPALLQQALADQPELTQSDQARRYQDLRQSLQQRQVQGDPTLSFVEPTSPVSQPNHEAATEALSPGNKFRSPQNGPTSAQDYKVNPALTISQAGPVGITEPVRPRKGRIGLVIAVGLVVLIALIAGIIIVAGRVGDATTPSVNYADASDVTYAPTPLTNEPLVGSRLFSFIAPELTSIGFDQTDQYIKVDTGLSSLRKVNYRNLVKGGLNPEREKIPPDAIFSPDKKHALTFQPYGTNIRTAPPSATQPTATPRPEDKIQTGRLTLYRADTYKSVLTVENVVRQYQLSEGEFAYSSDSKWLAFTYQQDSIGFIDLTTDKLSPETLPGDNPGRGKSLETESTVLFQDNQSHPFSPDGRFLHVQDYLSDDPNSQWEVYLYDLKALQTGGSLLGARPVLTNTISLVYSPDGKHAIKRSDRTDSNYALFSIEADGTFNRVASLVGAYKDNVPYGQPNHTIYYSPNFVNNDLILAYSRNPQRKSPTDPAAEAALITYSAKDGSMLGSFVAGNNVEYFKDRSVVVTVPDTLADKSASPTATDVVFYSIAERKEIGRISGLNQVFGLSANNKLLIGATKDGWIELYDTHTYQKVARLGQQFQLDDKGRVNASVEISPDRPLLLTKDRDNRVDLWRLDY